MKVALDVSAVPARVAGAGRYVVEISRRLAAPGLDATLVTRRGDADRWRGFAPNTSIAPVVPTSRVARLAYEAWLLGAGPVARGVDVWHGPHYTMPRRGSTPAVVTIHDLTFFSHPEWHEASKVAFFTRAIRYSARHARALVCVSDVTARALDVAVPDHAPVIVAPHGVDLDRFALAGDDDATVLAAAGMSPSAPFLLFVGTLEPRKGLDVLLDAFTELASDDVRLELWIAGQAGWGTDSLGRRLAESPVRARVRRLGFVDDAVLPALLRSAEAVVYPSRGEGFGLPVLEALACGAPTVTTTATVMEEVAGGAAFLAKAGDAADLARAIGDARRADRASVGARARSRAELFTWTASLARHRDAYDLAVR